MTLKKIFSGVIMVSLSLGAHAQTLKQEKEMQQYFEQSLKGSNSITVKTKRLSVKQIDSYRASVWNAWVKANQSVENPYTLPALDSLGAERKSAWQLPEELEPHATLNFYYGYKGVKPQKGYPFFLYLHGSGPKDKEWATGLLLAKRFKDSPSLYFIPQIPNEQGYYRWWQKSKQLAWENLLRQAMLNPNVDPNRLYVFGISEGGYGSQRLASFYADYWAAAGPMAGGEPLKNAPVENLSNTAFYFRTGANDRGFYRNLLTRFTSEALDSIKQLFPNDYKNYRVELIPDRQHFIEYDLTTPWLARQTRNARPKHFIWEDYEMDELHRKGFYNIVVNERPDAQLRTRYDVNIQENVVNIKVENITYTTLMTDPMFGIELKFSRAYAPATRGNFTLFLNEDMVDLTRPVTVVVNGKEVFNGKVALDTKNMLRSLSVFYDSQRIFPAAVDITIS